MRAEMKPTIHPETFLGVSARIIGAVRVEQDANIWPMVALRADSAEWSVVEQAHVPSPFEQRTEISSKLEKINPRLPEKFDGAWKTLEEEANL